MDRGALRGLFRTRVDDTAAGQLWDDGYVNDLLNEAVQEANLRARLLVDQTTDAVTLINVVAGTAKYQLNPSIIVLRRAEFQLTTGSMPPRVLERKSYDELDRRWPYWRSLTGTIPVNVIQDFDEHALTLSPVPECDGTLRLTVWRHPLDIEVMDTDADEPAIPVQYHRRLIEWAAYQAYSNKDVEKYDPNSADRALAMFTKEYGERPTVAQLRRLAVDHVDEAESYFF